MNFEAKIQHLHNNVVNALTQIERIENEFQNAKKFTTKFLDECAKAGITKVAIGTKHESVPTSISFPFGVQGSVFSFTPKGMKDRHTRIWGVCERMGISNGCGNTDQHQVNDSELIDGVYHLRNGVFHKIQN